MQTNADTVLAADLIGEMHCSQRIAFLAIHADGQALLETDGYLFRA